MPVPVTPPALDVDAVRALLEAGAQVVDVRPVETFTAGHVPGSLSNPLRPAFGTWLGWLADPERPVVVVRDQPGDSLDEVAWQALKVGYDKVVGELAGGLPAWRAAGLPVSTTSLVPPSEAAGDLGHVTVLDVRQGSEFAAGHAPGAVHLELGRLLDAEVVAAIPPGRVLVMCGHGERAMSAASLLLAAGRTDVAVLAGGPDELVAALGIDLARGLTAASPGERA